MVQTQKRPDLQADLVCVFPGGSAEQRENSGERVSVSGCSEPLR